jgi:predicted DNA-binding ArsR family transcriptional regulator
MISNVMTTREVAEYLGFTNPNSVSTWAMRYGVSPLYKQAGRKGVNIYARAAVIEGKRRMPGQGIGGGKPKKG